MTSERYIRRVLAGLLVLSVAIPLANYRLNAFGQFGDAKGLLRRVFGNEREAKYLLSRNYVPANFDAVLLGSSSSDNWKTGLLTSLRVFNASVNGGDVTEVAILAHKLFATDELKCAILVLSPYLLAETGRKTGFMTEADYWASFGSSQLAYDYITLGLERFGLLPNRYGSDGSDDFTLVGKGLPMSEILTRLDAKSFLAMNDRDWVARADARQELRLLVAFLRARGVFLVSVFPPVPSERLELRQAESRAFREDMASLGALGSVVVDFTEPQYDYIRRDHESFFDGWHLSASGASRVMDELDRVLREQRVFKQSTRNAQQTP